MTWRLKLILTLFVLWVFSIEARLVYWQVFKSKDLSLQATLQHTSSIIIPASRGEIMFSDGFPLVANKESYSMYINPKQLGTESSKIAELIETLPGSDSARLVWESAQHSNLSWVALAHNLSHSNKLEIEKKITSGIGFELEPVRIYPEGSPSAYLTGFVGKNDSGDPTGYFGLEGYYNRQLSGKEGRLIQERDAFDRPIVIGSENRIPPQNGLTLQTSIDRTVQHISFQSLEKGLSKYQASAGSVSIIESATGNVLAMVSLPGYDQNNFLMYSSSLYKNPIVSDSYEPGSTFKTIVMASALDAHVVTPKTKCEICGGPLVIGEYSIRSWNNQYYPTSNMYDVILHSDNVGMSFVARKLGKDKMFNYLHKFGIGKPTGIDIQEENSPPLRSEGDWKEIDLATASFGQGIAVTPIQMLTAVNTIATLGKRIPPRIVTHMGTPSNLKTLSRSPSSQVISQTAAIQMIQMMVNGVDNGEVRYYKPPGYQIAGKTGTAQVPIAGHYDTNSVIASFVGFVPAINPKFTMLVTLKDPHPSPWGSTTAAPLWFDIAKQLIRYYKIPQYAGK